MAELPTTPAGSSKPTADPPAGSGIAVADPPVEAPPPEPPTLSIPEPPGGWSDGESEALAMLLEAKGPDVIGELAGLAVRLQSDARLQIGELGKPHATAVQILRTAGEKLIERDGIWELVVKAHTLAGAAAGELPAVPPPAAEMVQEAVMKVPNGAGMLRALVADCTDRVAKRLQTASMRCSQFRQTASRGLSASTTRNMHIGDHATHTWLMEATRAMEERRTLAALHAQLIGSGTEATKNAGAAANAAIAEAGGPAKIATAIGDSRRLQRHWYETADGWTGLQAVERDLERTEKDLEALTLPSPHRNELQATRNQLVDRRKALRAGIDQDQTAAVGMLLERLAAGDVWARNEILRDAAATPAVFTPEFVAALSAIDLDATQTEAALAAIAFEANPNRAINQKVDLVSAPTAQ